VLRRAEAATVAAADAAEFAAEPQAPASDIDPDVLAAAIRLVQSQPDSFRPQGSRKRKQVDFDLPPSQDSQPSQASRPSQGGGKKKKIKQKLAQFRKG
jgi:hypothetical protein